MIGVIALVLVTIGNVMIREHWIEIVVLILTEVSAPVVMLISLRKGKIQTGGLVIALFMIFLILPVAFFFGGGLTGCVVSWYVFSYLFIGLILDNKPRTFMLILLTISVVVSYVLAYFWPNLVYEHDRFTWYMDSLLSVLVVSYTVYLMIVFQNRLFIRENKRAQQQALEIEALNRSQNRFFSSMSHEIRTPINTIIGLNEMILREDVSDEVAEDARNIQSASRMLLSLINDILDMSKMESGKMDIVRVSYDTGKMLSELVNMIWGRANEKGLKFAIDVDPYLPAQLFSDEVRIKQILINLLNNAVKYTEKGEVSLSIHCSRTTKGKVMVVYQVEDTGMGIRSESIPYLFDAFKRVDEEKNRYIEGTGLGLSIVKQLVELLGGEISVSSVYTKGSTFTVSIEQETVDEAVIGQFTPEKYHGHREKNSYHSAFEAPEAKVLIVDDNKANLLVASKLLRDTKVQIDTAESGEQCLKLTGQNHYDAIFMDHMMPQMDGVECFRRIREQTGGMCCSTPVVVLTANADSENRALYKKEGFDAYLLKPVEGAALEETLRSLLPGELMTVNESADTAYGSDAVVRQIRRKASIMITTDSVSDLPEDVIRSMNVRVLPYRVVTADGIFADGTEAKGDAILRYLADGKAAAKSESPERSDYEAFFAKELSDAQYILHIAMAKKASKGFANASEAALSFYNVRVVDSGHLSSGMGLMVMEAAREAENSSLDIKELGRSLSDMKDLIRTSFVVDDTEYLSRSGRLPGWLHKVCSALMIHPVIEMKDSAMTVGGIILGDREKARKKYIRRVLRGVSGIDTDTLFITYAGIPSEQLEEIQREAQSIVEFEHVYLQPASPAISINCGPGSFGLIYKRRNSHAG
ncbi:MAG: DegV family EDD domain-containing protein [Lachnospiraceae bacterium]|nr:DegV family EDD domain-containing protein [Lachnospiraceae bacterium]